MRFQNCVHRLNAKCIWVATVHVFVCEREFGARWSSFIRFLFSCMWFNWFISISSKLKRCKIIIFMCCTVCHQRLAFSSKPFHIASIRLHKLKFHFIMFKYSLSTEDYIVHLVYVCVRERAKPDDGKWISNAEECIEHDQGINIGRIDGIITTTQNTQNCYTKLD